MKKPNITKGKWEIVETKNEELLIVADDLIVCRINKLAELTDPNAKAISAVPEMMDALMEARGYINTKKNIFKQKYPNQEPGNINSKLKIIDNALEKTGVEL